MWSGSGLRLFKEPKSLKKQNEEIGNVHLNKVSHVEGILTHLVCDHLESYSINTALSESVWGMERQMRKENQLRRPSWWHGDTLYHPLVWGGRRSEACRHCLHIIPKAVCRWHWIVLAEASRREKYQHKQQACSSPSVSQWKMASRDDLREESLGELL